MIENKEEVFPLSFGWEEAWRNGGHTSPGWYVTFNEMIMLRRFILEKGLDKEYSEWFSREWPVVAKKINERMKDNIDLEKRYTKG